MDRTVLVTRQLKVISDFYDFVLWLTRHTEKFPRHHRYSLGTSMEARCQTILALLLRAKYGREKTTWLDEANVELDILRFQIRLAKDLGVLPFKSHEFAAKTLAMIGAQVGGWLKRKGRDG
jgi:hypothetical protein